MQRKNRITVTLTDQNYIKMKQTTEKTGITQTEFVNQACAGVSIFVMEQSKDIAKEFFLIRVALEKNEISENIREKVEKLCQLLNLLTEKIEKCRNSKI